MGKLRTLREELEEEIEISELEHRQAEGTKHAPRFGVKGCRSLGFAVACWRFNVWFVEPAQTARGEPSLDGRPNKWGVLIHLLVLVLSGLKSLFFEI